MIGDMEQKPERPLKWWMLGGFAAALALAHHWLIGWVELYFPTSSWQPTALRYALGIRNWLPLLPIAVALAALLGPKVPAMQRWVKPKAVFLFLVLLSLAHLGWILVPAVKHGAHGVPHRLPDAYRSVVLAADSMEILWLNAEYERGTEASPEHFRNYRIRSRATVAEAGQRASLGAAVIKSIEEYPFGSAMCFDPRHGLIARKGGVEIHLVICYECSAVYAFHGKRQAVAALNSVSRTDLNAFLVSQGIGVPVERKR